MSYQRKIAAGKRTEKDVAYYLNKELMNHKNVFLFNDIRFTDGESNVQIDHLIVYKYGFILIESKSIYGEVRVNESGEWSRSYQGKWIGMMSPMRQLEIQTQGLKHLLASQREQLLERVAFGMLPTFGGRNYDALCAVSSTSIIHRESAPKQIVKDVFKAEFIGKAVRKILKRMNITSPDFKEQELESIAAFFASLQESNSGLQTVAAANNTEVTVPPRQEQDFEQAIPAHAEKNPPTTQASCKHCRSHSVTPQAGRYGYYFKCNDCDKNTAMSNSCPACQGKAKARKKGSLFYLDCESCKTKTPLIEAP